MTYYRVLVSAPTLEEARELQLKLVEEKLLAGGLITSGESTFWWENKLTIKNYWNISGFTKEGLSSAIINRVNELSSDEVPIIAFFKIDIGNPEFLDWIAGTTRTAGKL